MFITNANLLFSYSLVKYPESIEIKFAYALFLLKKLKRRKKASEFLNGIKNLSPSIEEEFIIFRCNKMLEDNLSDLQDEEGENFDFIKELRYRNYFKHFMDLLKEASSLYIEFWNRLLDSYNNGHENVNKLNHCGTKINYIVEEIDYIFKEMKKLKANNFSCIKIYQEFVNNILCDKKKSKQFSNILNQIVEEYRRKIPPEFKNIDINYLNKNDYYQYIVVSTQPENFGIIANASLSISEIFGYETKDLIGQPLDLLIPDSFHEEHTKILKKKLREYKKKSYEEELQRNLESKEVNAFAKTKSKYLIELNMKTILYQSEYNEQFFIASFNKESSFYHTNTENNKAPVCYILTDLHLIIQHFTPNTSLYLGISSEMMNNNIEITYYIKQLYQEFLKYAIIMGELTPAQKLNIKRKIILKNYETPTLINWKRSDLNESRFVSTRLVDLLKKNNKAFTKENIPHEQLFFLSVNEEIINNKTVGYIFKLEIPNINELQNISISSNRLSLETKKKFIKYKSLNVNKKDEKFLQKIHIPSDFIPESQLSLQLDVNTLTYKLKKKKNGNDNSIQNYVKKKMSERMKLQKKIEEEDEEEEEDSEEDSSDFVKSDSLNVEIMKKKFSQQNKSLNSSLITNNKNEDYYKISFSKIKLYLYNFKKNLFEEILDYHKISQVEKRMMEGHKKKSEFKDDEIKHIEGNRKSNIDIEIQIMKKDNNEYLIQQIENALQKEEDQESIFKLTLNSIISFLILALMTILSMIYILNSIQIIKYNSILILNSGMMMGINGISVFYVKELILLNNENFTSYPTRLSKSDYVNLIYNELLLIFTEFDKYVAEDISIPLEVSNETEYEISKRNYHLANIKNDLNIIYTNNNLNSALIELSMDIFNICTKLLEEIIPTDRDVFHFLSNSLNYIGEGFYSQLNVYVEEIFKQTKKIKIICLIGFSCIIFFLINVYYLISRAYCEVNEKKENYIEIFYDIDFEVIRNCIERSENYFKKLKGEEEEYDETEHFRSNDLIQKNKTIVHHSDRHLKRKKRAKELSKKFLIKILLFLILLALYYFLILYLFILFLEQSCVNLKYSQQECLCENEYHLIFNSLREAFYDKNSKVFNLGVEEFLQKELDKLYVTRRKANEYMNEHRKSLPSGFYESFTLLATREPCDFRLDDYFIDLEECESFMNNATKYGLDLTASYFVEEVRFADQFRRTKSYYLENSNNLTLIGTQYYNKTWISNSNDVNKYDLINFFNNELMNNLSIFYRNFMIPLYSGLRFIHVDAIKNYLKRIKFIFVLLFSIYMSFVLLVFFFYWIPYVRNLNKVIFKTKSLLSIIPKEVLINIREIYTLLGIDDKSFKNIENKH